MTPPVPDYFNLIYMFNLSSSPLKLIIYYVINIINFVYYCDRAINYHIKLVFKRL